MNNPWSRFVFTVLVTTAAFSCGCRSTYYAAWEKLGKHKRDLLKENVEKARDEQVEASQEFKDALTRLKELYQFQGGDLEERYNKLKGDYDQAAAKASDVQDRVKNVEQIAADLFKEWDSEIESMTSASLKASSRTKLRETKAKYETLHAAMKKAEQSMEPVLTQFRDQTLYLKHNLNAAAIGALKKESLDIEREINRLIQDMNQAIAQADVFIKAMP